jgi:transcriptional regulator with XRE-family HTH domain
MPSRTLPNYLRMHRKRAGFSEDEMAFLLGLHSASPISRYEHFHSIPGLLTALAYHAVFQTSPPELFGGKYQKVARMVRRRAKRLLKNLAKGPQNPRTARKLVLLRSIAGEPEITEHP